METKRHEFEAFFNNAAIGIITIGSNGKILLINNFALNQFGYTLEEVLDKPIEVLIPARFKTKHVQHRDNFHQNNPHNRPMGQGMDLFALKKNGTEFPVEVSLSSYKDQDGQFSIAFVSDISIRKNSELALVKLNEELERKVEERTQSLQEALEKEKEVNELKSRFISMASHEFRTPLSTILSSAYLVQQYTDSEGQAKRDKHIQRIVTSVNMLTDILNDVLSVGKIEEGKIQVRLLDIDIKESMSTFINELNTILKPGQSITYTHTGDTEIVIDPTMLKHILINLVSNAIKFSPENSPIQIATSKNKHSLKLSVKDNGIGISQEDQQHLFERFFRGANVTNIQGTGLGLHIVTKYAELLDGTVSFKSELDNGTEFTIEFKQN